MQRLRELYRFRDVIRNFVSRDLKIRYRRSILGFFWTVLNPLLFMVVLSSVFRILLRGTENYPLYVFSSLLPWLFFSQSLAVCASSIIAAEPFIKSQYFPKLVFPLTGVLQCLVNFLLSLLVLFLAMAPFLDFRPSWSLAILPFSIFLLFLAVLGVGAVLALLTVYFRDLEHLLGVGLTALMYLTPIIYPIQNPPIPERYHAYFKLNPVYHLIQMFTTPIWKGVLPSTGEILTASGIAVGALAVGLWVFWRVEDDLVFRL